MKSGTYLFHRYVNVDRKRQQSARPLANRATSDDNGLPTPTNDTTDFEDSDSVESLSHRSTTDLHETHPTATPNTTPSSYLDLLSGSSFDMPYPFNLTEAISPQARSISFPSKDLEINNIFTSIPDNNEVLPSNYFFHQQNGQNLQQDPVISRGHDDSPRGFEDGVLSINPSWNIPGLEPDSPMPNKELEGIMEEQLTGSSHAMSSDQSQGVKPAITLVLEDIQPQMVTKIIDVLFEAKATVKMKIVS